MWEIPGVEHIYSMAGDGMALVTVRFKVGEDQETSVAKVHAKLFAATDRAPAGAMPPLVKPHSIDDVPILALTLHSQRYGSDELRSMAVHLEDEVRTIPDVAETSVIGGEPRQMRVALDPGAARRERRLAGRGGAARFGRERAAPGRRVRERRPGVPRAGRRAAA